MAPTHYDTLGVAPGASPAQLRRAYLERARLLHPDRYVDASTGDRAAAQRRMQEVNEAWRVLGNPLRRRRYDHELTSAPAPRAGAYRPTAEPEYHLVEDEPVDGPVQLIRGLPWVLILIVLGAIFVFTAYATAPEKRDPTADGECIVVRSGPVVLDGECDVAGARHVDSRVVGSDPCPPGTERLQPVDSAWAWCLEVASGS